MKHIQKQFIRQLEDFFSSRSEETLAEVYELGRRSLNEGIGELEILQMVEEAYRQLSTGSGSVSAGDSGEAQLRLNLNFLAECLAPYEMRQRGYQDLIRQLKNQNLKLQEEIHRRKKSEKELRNLTAKQDKIREEERIRIAREIHDELGQMLTVLKMEMALMVKRAGKVPENEVAAIFSAGVGEFSGKIDAIIRSVQRITADLRPEVLDDIGLAEAIEWQATEFKKKTGIDFGFDIEPGVVENLDDERSTAIFRIFQETLTNILRHSGASHVDIRLKQEGRFVILHVHDNGKGISPQKIEHSASLGIIGMRERSQFLGGDISFVVNRGTSVILKIPAEESSGMSAE